jgi:hypothetical protein
LIEEARTRARTRRRRFLLATLAGLGIAVAVALALASGDDERGTSSDAGGASLGVDAESGVVQGSVTLSLRPAETAGSQAISGSTTIAFQGPFVAADNGMPQFALDLSWDQPGVQPISFSLVATESAGFLIFDDRVYQASPEVFDQIRGGEVLSSLAPERWMETQPSSDIDDDPAGEVVRVSGPLDVTALASDLTRAASELGIDNGVEAPVPSSAFTERRISFESAPTGGLEGLALEAGWAGESDEMGPFRASVSADLAFNQLNESQQVETPSGAQPIETVDRQAFPPELWGLVEFLQGG